MRKLISIAFLILLVPNVMSQKYWGRGGGLVLLSPLHNSEINTTEITFEWAYQYDNETNNLNYEMLFGEYLGSESSLENQEINPKTTKFTKSGLLRGKKYQWRIICRDGEKAITWVDGLFTIAVDKMNGNSVTKRCTYCNGTGTKLIPESFKTCPKCNGTGRIDWGGGKKFKCEYPMGLCNGTGKVKVPAHYESCTYCDGTGYTDHSPLE